MNVFIKNRSFFAQSLFFAAHLFIATSLCASEKNNEFFTAPLTPQSQRGNAHFVEDANGKKFILKYPRGTEYAIRDALGANVGEAVGININSVKILPPHDPSINSIDEYPHSAKTLHTVVPGEEAYDMNIDILGGLKRHNHLNSLILHKDLCKIIALDIYLDNWDRHNGNLLYDKKNNHFYAIDMDMILSGRQQYSLPTRAIAFVEKLNKDGLSQPEKNALKRVNKTLHKLTSQCPPEKLQSTRTELAKEAHHIYSSSEQQDFKNLTEYNFQETKRLQVLLRQFHKHAPTSAHFILKHMAKPSRTAQNSFWETMHS